MDEDDPVKNLFDTIEDVSKKEANYKRMRWIAVDRLAEASVFIERCKMEEALTQVQIAESALKEMYVEKETPLVKHLLSGVSYIQSFLFSTKDSQSAANRASRIGGMLEIIVIIMRG